MTTALLYLVTSYVEDSHNDNAVTNMLSPLEMGVCAPIVIFLSILSPIYSFSFHAVSRYFPTKLKMAVDAKDSYKIAVLKGDGIGPEIVEATLPVLNAVGLNGGFTFEFEYADIGGIATKDLRDSDAPHQPPATPATPRDSPRHQHRSKYGLYDP